MTVTVAAALKKIAVSLLTSEKGRKMIVGIVSTVIVLIALPFMLIAYIFGGTGEEIGAADSWEYVDGYIDEEHKQVLDEVYSRFESNDMTDRYTEAKVLTLYYLYAFAADDDFVFRLITCFSDDQSISELAAEVSEMFGVEVNAEEFNQLVEYYASDDTSEERENNET